MAPQKQSYTSAGLLNQAATFHRQGKSDKAIKFYQKVLKSEPANFYALDGLGSLYGQQGRFKDALACFDKAVKLQPNDFAVHFNRGMALNSLKRFDDALICFDRAIALKADVAQAYNSRGSALKGLGRAEEALASFDRALAIEPHYPGALNNRGAVLLEEARQKDALTCFDRAIAMQADFAEAHYNRALALNELNQKELALAAYDQALSINANYADAHYNRANLLRDAGMYQGALAAYSDALKANPNHPFAHGDRLLAQLYLGVWDSFDQRVKQVVKGLQQGNAVLPPFHMFAIPAPPALLKKSAAIFTQIKYPQKSTPLWQGERYQHERIRIGYFSADLHNHATAYLMAGLFEQHDRSRFEIYAFSFGPNKQDEMRARLEKGFDHFYEMSAESSETIACKARELEIDIAVDLKGYTLDCRAEIFAWRPAPVQVNYLGFPGTMAAPYMDYIIADRVLIPDDQFDMYSEKVVHLPHSYQVNDAARQIAETVPSRTAMGLPEQGFVFCCFNNSFKITPDVFSIWMRLLQAVPGSVLWLFEGNKSVCDNFCREAEKRGVAAERLVFASRLPLPEHLARHACADLFLDTFYYNAHTTASDALWAGLPLLTCAGETFAGRVAASLLEAVGLPNMITLDHQAYEALALKLATDTAALAEVRQQLAHNRLSEPLFDTDLFAKHIEQAYGEMWRRAQAGLPPEHFKV